MHVDKEFQVVDRLKHSPHKQRYLVTIFYREPTYAKYAGDKTDPFRASYEVEALNIVTARMLALKAFRETEKSSSVGWIRTVERIDCQVIGDDVVCKGMTEE